MPASPEKSTRANSAELPHDDIGRIATGRTEDPGTGECARTGEVQTAIGVRYRVSSGGRPTNAASGDPRYEGV